MAKKLARVGADRAASLRLRRPSVSGVEKS
jgi:hypothetical protein